MSQSWPDFCGLSYTFQNRYAAIERTVNWYCDVNESRQEKKWQLSLAPSPGNSAFGTLPVPPPCNQPARALIEYRGKVYGVNGSVIFMLNPDGTYVVLVDTAAATPAQDLQFNNGKPLCMVANGNNQIFVTSGNSKVGYVINTAAQPVPTVQGITGNDPAGNPSFLGASYATFQDGYIIVVTPNSNQIQISGNDDVPVGDATQWSAANVSIQEGQADYLQALISSREYLRLLGFRRSQIYQNVAAQGLGGFPFENYNETFIETGIAAPYSLVNLGDALMWLGEDDRGIRAAWRDAAFAPVRASNFGVEQAWQSYARIDDCVAFPFIWKGHLMAQYTFPSANATWVYDDTVSKMLGRPAWYERQFLNAQNLLVSRPEQFHCYAYGRHLVSSSGTDGNPGAVYAYADSPDCCQQNGIQIQQPLVRDRIAPHIFQGNNRIVYNRIQFDVTRGTGLDGGQQPQNPTMMLRWSDDSETWSNEQELNVGRIGQYAKKIYLNRLGASAYGGGRVFWLRCSDPVFWGVTGVELDMFVCGD